MQFAALRWPGESEEPVLRSVNAIASGGVEATICIGPRRLVSLVGWGDAIAERSVATANRIARPTL